MTAITVDRLHKTYTVPEREGGLRAAVGSLVRRRTRQVRAVAEVSFEIDHGEVVGFLGPNGAGKTTTLKMLAGLLHPTSGEARVLGSTPWQRERSYLSRMALIMGQRNQLQWDIPVLDSYRLNQAVFRIPDAQFRSRLDELTELLELQALLRKPVRNLSLGERMKCEIAGSLLHAPQVLFLDEPTIGLDVAMQRRIRSFVADYNRRTGACVMLTSHYMADVEALCRRVIVIHHGRLLFDGGLTDLVHRFAAEKTITVELEESRADDADLARLVGGHPLERSATGISVRVPKAETARVAARLLAELPVVDLVVEEPPIESVIEQVFDAPEEQPSGQEVTGG
ncbi:ATP-binding cassette domain-containing protein [Auraticoccus sp. F435]|uniref:ATP-binding cassette domain-containing protein n=1 Tax=Auraticoccus cholistanensis TaxID=2656650 RepID=A0A6A9V089_9ACTN|nr:ATP-binding cassette domain-containing protein [Auraticoccus cholistanensis]MVA75000.1 ATP-binding cassette domain-containing protein [Auraticoccus cholistanensis]